MLEDVSLKNKKLTVLIIIFMIMNFLSLCFRDLLSSYISTTDECNYIVAALQLYKGNRLVVDSWNILQFNGILLLPFVSLFIKIFGSTEGIVLFFRVVYNFIKILICFWAIWKLRKYKKFSYLSVVAVLLFLYSTPYNISALSYNTIPAMCLFMILIGCYVGEYNRFHCIIYGVVYSIAILSNPYLVIGYFAGWFLVFLFHKDKEYNGLFKVKSYLYFTLGITIIGLSIVIYLISCSSITEILYNIKAIISSGGHALSESGSFFKSRMVVTFIEGITIMLPVTIINIVCIIFLLFFKKSKEKQIVISLISALLSIVYVYIFKDDFSAWFKENLIFIPLLWTAFESLFFISNKKKYIKYILPGIIYTLIVSKSTDTGILSTSAAMIIVAVAMFLMWSDEQFELKKIKLYVFRGAIALIIIFVIIFRVFFIWTGSVSVYNYYGRAKSGPLKYTFMGYILGAYEHDLKSFEEHPVSDDSKLCIYSLDPLIYLYYECDFGTYSTVFREMDKDAEMEFFRTHKDRIPDVVFFDDQRELTREDELDAFFIDNYIIERDDYGNTWLERK